MVTKLIMTADKMSIRVCEDVECDLFKVLSNPNYSKRIKNIMNELCITSISQTPSEQSSLSITISGDVKEGEIIDLTEAVYKAQKAFATVVNELAVIREEEIENEIRKFPSMDACHNENDGTILVSDKAVEDTIVFISKIETLKRLPKDCSLGSTQISTTGYEVYVKDPLEVIINKIRNSKK